MNVITPFKDHLQHFSAFLDQICPKIAQVNTLLEDLRSLFSNFHQAESAKLNDYPVFDLKFYEKHL